MRRRGWGFALVARLVVGALIVGVAVTGLHGRAPAHTALFPYPPNARQLIAAGLTGRPRRGSRSAPVAVDMVLADGNQTTVLFHVTQEAQSTGPGRFAVPAITLLDDHNHGYDPRQGETTGGVMSDGSGPLGFLWQMVSVFVARQPATGYMAFAPLPPTTRMALVRVFYGGTVEWVRVPLHLAALGRLNAVTRPHAVAAGHGVVVRLARLSRTVGSVQLDFTVDAPAFAITMPLVRDAVVDARGRALPSTDGSGSCGVPVQPKARMHCTQSLTFAPPPRGTRLWLSVSLVNGLGRSALPGGPWRVPFTTP